MSRIIDAFLTYAERKPGRVIGWVFGVAGFVLVSYWTASGHFGESARLAYGLLIIIGAIIVVSRHMSHRETTDDFKATRSREEMIIADALYKFRTGEPLTTEDIAALRLREKGDIM